MSRDLQQKSCIVVRALLPLQTRGGVDCSCIFVKTLAWSRGFDDDRALLLRVDKSDIVILLGVPMFMRCVERHALN